MQKLVFFCSTDLPGHMPYGPSITKLKRRWAARLGCWSSIDSSTTYCIFVFFRVSTLGQISLVQHTEYCSQKLSPSQGSAVHFYVPNLQRSDAKYSRIFRMVWNHETFTSVRPVPCPNWCGKINRQKFHLSRFATLGPNKNWQPYILMMILSSSFHMSDFYLNSIV